ncbi:MAG: flagellar biosynthetic protein FliR [Pirellulaceae bacterium]
MTQYMLEPLILGFVLMLTRIGAFIVFFPLFGGRRLPNLVKVGLSVSLTLCWFPIVPNHMLFHASAADGPAAWLQFAVCVLREVIVGGAIGFAFGLFLEPARIAGSYIGNEMGLNQASLIDPGTNVMTNIVGEIFQSFAILLLLGANVHHGILTVVYQSFFALPIGKFWSDAPLDALVVESSQVHRDGVLLAAPVGICLFLTIVMLGVLMKASPQINIFSLGFTLRLTVGLGALLVFLPAMAVHLQWLIQESAIDWMRFFR